MEYEFRHDTVTGNATATFSYEHQVLGPWLEVEVGQSIKQLSKVLQGIDQVLSAEQQEVLLIGQEYTLVITKNDVEVSANSLMDTTNEVPELASDELNIDESSTASCGIDDFRTLLMSWAQFIKKA
ncbi:YacL family protein [Thalassotalea piscium]|uniref:Uncharacterized protein n=1 Tax=Thalassotalea piscium TaxID=1230533 RepID=A0A7X0NDN8_9GAMM|nr:YacL family protein [Thalassotalea piscium]MBB6541539.1 hypothetical protein [Thalassotalea piscium]